MMSGSNLHIGNLSVSFFLQWNETEIARSDREFFNQVVVFLACRFSAEVFNGIQEEVTVTASRCQKLTSRVKRIESTLSPLEKAVLSQTSHIHFAYTAGLAFTLISSMSILSSNFCSVPLLLWNVIWRHIIYSFVWCIYVWSFVQKSSYFFRFSFVCVVGCEWHPRIRNGQRHFVQSDLPLCVMETYEQCRDPPPLHLLDRWGKSV